MKTAGHASHRAAAVNHGRRAALRAAPALLLAGGLARAQQAAAPQAALQQGVLPQGIPPQAVAQRGLDTAGVERAAEDADLHSVIVWQAGRTLLEHYRRSMDKPINDWFSRDVAFGPDVLHDMRSISKSVVALLVGQAVGRGQIDVATPVLDFFPALSDLRRDGREAIRVSHLLDMASGLAWNETTRSYGSAANDETRLWWDGRPARYVLDRPLAAAPGTLWNYNGGHTALLAEILVQRSGRGLLDLVGSDLFEPLGITQWQWRRGLQRQPLAYAGLRLTPPGLLRLGQLLLADGMWQGRQIVPADWVQASLKPSITIGQGPLRYGHHWWHGTVQHNGGDVAWTAGVGNGGQRLYVVPALALAVVFTAGAYNADVIGRTELALFRKIVGMV